MKESLTFWQVIEIHILPPAISALGVILAAWVTVKHHAEKQAGKIEEIRLSVNHRLDEFLAAAKQVGYDEGRQAERDSK